VKDGALVSSEILFCLLAAIDACLTNNITIGLLLRAKQKKGSIFLALGSNFHMLNIFPNKKSKER